MKTEEWKYQRGNLYLYLSFSTLLIHLVILDKRGFESCKQA